MVAVLLVFGGGATGFGQERIHQILENESLEAIAKKSGCDLELFYTYNTRSDKKGRYVDLSSLVSHFDPLPEGKLLRLPSEGECRGGKASSSRVGSVLSSPSSDIPMNCGWSSQDIDTNKLRGLMDERGFVPPPRFRALVIKHRLERDVQGRPQRVTHALFDYGGLASDWQNWNPASTIKVYSGLAAAKRVTGLGFDPEQVELTYHDTDGDRTYSMRELLELAMHISKNVPHNRLVQLAGFDFINGPFGFLKDRGLEHSYIMTGYALTEWTALGQSRSLRASPAITLQQGERVVRLKSQKSTDPYPCPRAACTTLSDLAKLMCYDVLKRGLVLKSGLPTLDQSHYGRPLGAGAAEATKPLLDVYHFISARDHGVGAADRKIAGLKPKDLQSRLLQHIREALGSEGLLFGMFHRAYLESVPGEDEHFPWLTSKLDRTRAGRKDPVWEVFKKYAGRIYRKSGYSMKWASDNLLLYLLDEEEKEMPRMEWAPQRPGDPADDIRYSVTMACHPGRYCLKEAAVVVSKILISGAL